MYIVMGVNAFRQRVPVLTVETEELADSREGRGHDDKALEEGSGRDTHPALPFTSCGALDPGLSLGLSSLLSIRRDMIDHFGSTCTEIGVVP